MLDLVHIIEGVLLFYLIYAFFTGVIGQILGLIVVISTIVFHSELVNIFKENVPIEVNEGTYIL
ncbi:MAG: hypothetical protein HOG49_33395, partial [Candidatus Scalindua sp.]|nr:hypothetical protein [Candidatus Scalindua sp.]